MVGGERVTFTRSPGSDTPGGKPGGNAMSNARKSYQELVDDPTTDLDLLDRIEEQLIAQGVNRPLSNSTPPAEWAVYWQRIADAYESRRVGP